MMMAGIGIILIPLIEWVLTAILNIKIWSSVTQNNGTNVVIHILFYWSVFYLIHRLCDYISGQKTTLISHPLIKKACDVHRPIVYAILGIIITFFIMGYEVLIFPLVFVLLGIMLNVYGRFSTKTIYYVSWSFILVGLISVLLTKLNISYLWMFGTTYLGLAYVIMGYSCRNRVRHNG